jgi:RNA polymerase sigma-70 factor, ECF subfamily
MSALETSLASGSAIIGDLFHTNIRRPESTRPTSRSRKLLSVDRQFTSPAMLEDWNLIRQAVVGNPEAQERLFKRHTPRLYRAVIAILRNKEDAEDAVQDSWCRAYAKLDSYEGRAAFSLNDILDHQAESLFDGTVARPPNPEQIYVASELNALIEEQIRELPPRIQATFRLRKSEEFSVTETARALRIRESAVKSRVSRARTKVARGLRKLLSAPPRLHAVDRSSAQPRLKQKFASLR